MEPQKKADHLRPEPRRRASQKSSTSILGNLIAHAKRGHDDFISPELMQDNRRKEEEYERSHKRPRRGPPPLPNLQTLQRMRNTLRDSTTSKGDSYYPDYRKIPDDTYRAQKTQRPKPSYTETPPRHTPTAHLANLFVSDRSTRVNCQVSLCEHEYYAIDWESSDPDNRKGSWIAHLRHYWDYPSSRDDHKKCQPPNIQSRCNVLAERIIAKSLENEDRKSLGRDRRNGAVTRPSFESVYREVRIMYSHLFRGNAEDVIKEKEEAARKNHDRFSQREILAEKTQQQAQAERQRKELAKGLDIKESVKESPKKRTRMDDGDTAQCPKEAPKKKQKISVPEDRFKPTTKEEREQRLIQIKKSIRAQNTLKIEKIKEEKKAASSKVARVKPESNKDKHAPTKVSAPQIPKPQGPKKKKELTPEERKILKSIQLAEAEETKAYTPDIIEEPKQQPEDTLDDEAHILSPLADPAKQDILLAPSTSKTATTKATLPQETNTVEQTSSASTQESADSHNSSDNTSITATMSKVQNQSHTPSPPLSSKTPTFPHNQQSRPTPPSPPLTETETTATETSEPDTPPAPHKSAPVVQDSDEETDYAIPHVATEVPVDRVRGEFEAETGLIVEQVVQGLEGGGGGIGMDSSPSSPPPPQTQKLKRSSTASEDSTSPPHAKQAETKTVEFAPEAELLLYVGDWGDGDEDGDEDEFEDGGEDGDEDEMRDLFEE